MGPLTPIPPTRPRLRLGPIPSPSRSLRFCTSGHEFLEGYTGVGMDVVGAGCEDRRKYQWWTLGEQPYDNVWHTSHTH